MRQISSVLIVTHVNCHNGDIDEACDMWLLWFVCHFWIIGHLHVINGIREVFELCGTRVICENGHIADIHDIWTHDMFIICHMCEICDTHDTCDIYCLCDIKVNCDRRTLFIICGTYDFGACMWHGFDVYDLAVTSKLHMRHVWNVCVNYDIYDHYDIYDTDHISDMFEIYDI